MRYISTRGQGEPRSFSDVLLEGLAPDGGLYVPESYPLLSPSDLSDMKDWSYNRIALHVLKLFVGEDIRESVLKSLIEEAYTASKFGSLDITPIQPLAGRTALLKLSNGPTMAFKDIGMQLLTLLMDYVLTERDEYLNILGATSGDTGSAAEEAARSKSRLRVIMLSPYGRMTQFQRKQMYTIDDPRVFNLVADGTFHDHQTAVKMVNEDAEFKQRYSIGAVNSINWARIVAQVVYHVYGYVRTIQSSSEVMTVVVPSGNFGNALATYVAGQMGLRMNIIVATNENDVLAKFYKTGVYRVREREEVLETYSPSMDIASASNFERYMFDYLGRDPERLKELWQDLKTSGRFSLGGSPYYDGNAHLGFSSGSATDVEVIETIRMVYNRYGIVIDPHTAVGAKVGFELYPGECFGPMLIAETALPAKFEEAIEKAIGLKMDVRSRYREMFSRPEIFTRIDKADPAAIAEEVKTFIANKVPG